MITSKVFPVSLIMSLIDEEHDLNVNRDDVVVEKDEDVPSTDNVKITPVDVKNDDESSLDTIDKLSNVQIDEDYYDEYEQELAEEEEEEEPFVSIFDVLDAPRLLLPPIDLTIDIVDKMQKELGIISLCWPDLKEVKFEDRTTFLESYLKNTDKEKLLLLYTENFRRQFVSKFPKRKPLFLSASNICGMQVSKLLTRAKENLQEKFAILC